MLSLCPGLLRSSTSSSGSLLLPRLGRLGAPMGAPGSVDASVRAFSIYQGQKVTSDQLLKKNDEWLIEETNFCLGRVTVCGLIAAPVVVAGTPAIATAAAVAATPAIAAAPAAAAVARRRMLLQKNGGDGSSI